jgi:hypothetical protein
VDAQRRFVDVKDWSKAGFFAGSLPARDKPAGYSDPANEDTPPVLMWIFQG